ncbi:hypothetical protein Q7P37_004179 [Cladosporium fusiforme]
MTLHLGIHPNRNSEQQSEIREARRMLQGRVRNDWDYPVLPKWQKPEREKTPQQNDDEATVAGFKFHAQPEAIEHQEPLEWRERDYASSDENSGDDEAEIAAMRESSAKKTKGLHKFDGPDTVAQEISNRRLARKRKRKELLEEEMAWNDGLSHWTVRREAWSGAKTTDQVRSLQERRVDEAKADSASASASAGSTPRTSTSSASAQATSTSTSATSPDADINVAGMSITPPSHMLVPVVPKILPNHPIRKKISPSMYPEIYNKIIVQARTPSVPINLSTMIRALVQGWKDDGEWPPKPGPIEKSITKKGVKNKFAKILRITGGDSITPK